MTGRSYDELSRREREIMDVVYRRRTATAAEILKDLRDPPSYSAVRATLRILEEKGHLKHEKTGNRYVYSATHSRKKVRRKALGRVLSTFFDGSTEQAFAALLDMSGKDLSKSELDRIAKLIDAAKKEGR